MFNVKGLLDQKCWRTLKHDSGPTAAKISDFHDNLIIKAEMIGLLLMIPAESWVM